MLVEQHEHYEELCALAASGQASQPDLADLEAHLETCPSCRSFTDDVMQLSAQSLSMLALRNDPNRDSLRNDPKILLPGRAPKASQ